MKARYSLGGRDTFAKKIGKHASQSLAVPSIQTWFNKPSMNYNKKTW